jgi:hypothetical protein
VTVVSQPFSIASTPELVIGIGNFSGQGKRTAEFGHHTGMIISPRPLEDSVRPDDAMVWLLQERL